MARPLGRFLPMTSNAIASQTLGLSFKPKGKQIKSPKEKNSAPVRGGDPRALLVETLDGSLRTADSVLVPPFASRIRLPSDLPISNHKEGLGNKDRSGP